MLSFLQGGGQMGQAIAAMDWRDTPIGPPDTWPPSLKTATSLMLTSGFPQCMFWGKELLSLYNDAYAPLMGNKHPALGRRIPEIWAEIWDDLAPIAERAANGEASFFEDYELKMDRGDGFKSAFFTFSYSPIRDETGAIVGILNTVVETTAVVAAQRQVQLLNDELSHRMKNMLSIVQAIAAQTFSPADGALQDSFALRLQSLAGANDLLVNNQWGSASLGDIIARAVAPLVNDPGRISVAGPPVMLHRKQSLSMALAIHELSTNALKYGALSELGGRVAIEWECTADEQFRFEWVELGGPPVPDALGKGFGTRLLARVLPAEFGGKGTIDAAATGLCYRLVAPSASLADASSGATGPGPSPSLALSARPL